MATLFGRVGDHRGELHFAGHLAIHARLAGKLADGRALLHEFGFEIEQALRAPDDDRVLHAQLRTGSGVIFVGPGMQAFGTQGTPDPGCVASMTYVFVDDVDAHYARSKAAGATIREEPKVHFGGNKQYTVSDPGGQRWTFAQPLEDPE